MKRNVGWMILLFAVLIGGAGCAFGTIEGGGAIGRIAGDGLRIYAPAAPVPADARIIPPSADIPDNIRTFSGAWVGHWGEGRFLAWLANGGDQKGESKEHRLLVENIISPEKASVIFSNGESQTRVRWRPVRGAMWQRTVAEFKNGTLVVEALGARAVYRRNPDGTLAAEISEHGMPTLKATLYRMNLSQKEAKAKE